MRQNTWGLPSATRRITPSAGASTGWKHQHRGRQVEAHDARPNSLAYLAGYEDATEQAYVVRTLAHDRLIQVPRSYAPAELFPVVSGQSAPGARLLRWSVYALLGVGLGGLGGLLLGVPVVLVACVQLARFARRVQRWRQRQQGPAGHPMLPPAAGTERLRLLGALGQGVLAIVLGSLLLGLLAWHLLG